MIEQDTVICRLSGDLDVSSAPWAVGAVDRAAARPDLRVLVLDASAVRFVDSSGLAVFVQARNRSLQRGFRLEVRGASEHLSATLDKVGLGAMLTMT